jgi:hypothetical protein
MDPVICENITLGVHFYQHQQIDDVYNATRDIQTIGHELHTITPCPDWGNVCTTYSTKCDKI